MGRSVSVPGDAVLVAYDRWQTIYTDEEVAEFKEDYGYDPTTDDDWITEEWRNYLEYIEETAQRLWPSLESVDQWIGENHVLLANDFGSFGVSEYCGVVAIWFVPDPSTNLSLGWAKSITETFHREFGTMTKLGNLSDGTSAYHLKDVA